MVLKHFHFVKKFVGMAEDLIHNVMMETINLVMDVQVFVRNNQDISVPKVLRKRRAFVGL